MSGPRAGCPGCSPDVRASCQISGPSHSRMHFCAVLLPDIRPSTPDVRPPCRISGHSCPENVFMLGCAPDVRPPAGCPGLPVLPDVRAWPGCPAPLFSALVLFSVPHILPGQMSGPLPGCPACSFSYTTTAIFMLTLYIPLVLHGRGWTIHFEQTLEHFSLSLSLSQSYTPNLRSPRDLRAFERSCPIK